VRCTAVPSVANCCKLLQTIANYCKLLHLFVDPATPPGLWTPRYHAEISVGYARMRLQSSSAAL